jgi:kynurenine formamidase
MTDPVADPVTGPVTARWGADDERGALNLQTPHSVLAGLRAASTGRVFSLGLPVQRAGVPHVPHRPTPQRMTLTSHTDEATMFTPLGAARGTGSHEDVVTLATHEATHMDALGHVYEGESLYNGFPHDAATTYGGLARCGIDKAGPIVARGVLLDVPGACGPLDPGYVITVADIEACLERQQTTLTPGCVALVRTGWLEAFDPMTGLTYEQPGIGLEAAAYLGDRDVIAVGADNTAVEAMPFEGGGFMPVHVELLVRRGIYLLEHLVLAGLASEGVSEFLFIAAPLPITGASGSPICPVAVA